MATQDKGVDFTDSVHRLTRLSSQRDYVVVDREATNVLRSEKRIKKAQSPDGVFYELQHSIKSKMKSLFSPQPLHSAADIDKNPYHTSDWDDERSDREHYIIAKHVAEFGSIHSAISTLYPIIHGHSYTLHKFKIIQKEDENGEVERDYLLQIEVDAGPGLQYIYGIVNASEINGLQRLTLIQSSLYPPPK